MSFVQLVKNGPYLPKRLLDLHEEGRVVFFCGAGISRAAELPDFECLTNQLYKRFQPYPYDAQKLEIAAKRYDTAIHLLETTHVRGRKIRKKLMRILKHNLDTRHATSIHKALLTLSKSREDNRTRIVTTNFDRIFEKVIKREKLHVERYDAPRLPTALKSDWDGVVYLHGLLPKRSISNRKKAIALDKLVLSSGDFGRAYLAEGWAARFVTELFHNYNVCFIGYSVNDPILRYLTDSLAIDQLRGENPPEMFAFDMCCDSENYKARAEEWENKTISPILYHRDERGCHGHLRETLHKWADVYRSNVEGKKLIVMKYAWRDPSENSEYDNFISRLLWALRDPTGLPMKFFANIDPAPPLRWMEYLCQRYSDNFTVSQFNIPYETKLVNDLNSDEIKNMHPYLFQHWRKLITNNASNDPLLDSLTSWLVRHLDKPSLLLDLSRYANGLCNDFASAIEDRMNGLIRLQRSGRINKLMYIRANAPYAVPRKAMYNMWHFMIGGYIKPHFRYGAPSISASKWVRSVKDEGLAFINRMALRKLFRPHVRLTHLEELSDIKHPNDIFTCDVTTYHSDIRSLLNVIGSITHDYNESSFSLLLEFSSLLNKTLDFMNELGLVMHEKDGSCLLIPSIDEYDKDRTGRFRNLEVLIILVRDTWLTVAMHNPTQARSAVESWQHIPYPSFRRLSFFAAIRTDIIECEQALHWLLQNDRWWLWSTDTKREVEHLLTSLVPRLNSQDLAKLEDAILKGPPEEIFNEAWTNGNNRAGEEMILKLLTVLSATGVDLRADAKHEFYRLSTKYQIYSPFG